MGQAIRKKSTYSAMIFYIVVYYIFVIFFKDRTEHFDFIRISFESIALFWVLFIMIRRNIKENKKLALIVTTLIAVIANSIGQDFEVYYELIKDTGIRNYIVKDGLSIIASIIFSLFLFMKSIKIKKENLLRF